VPIFPVSNSILLWGITTWVLPLNSMFFQILTDTLPSPRVNPLEGSPM
jgi:hypothetical protein